MNLNNGTKDTLYKLKCGAVAKHLTLNGEAIHPDRLTFISGCDEYHEAGGMYMCRDGALYYYKENGLFGGEERNASFLMHVDREIVP